MSCCNKGKKQKLAQVSKDGFVAQSIREIRMNICRKCGFFRATDWYCHSANTSARHLCKGGSCPFDKWK